MSKVYTSITLSDGTIADILEPKGIHYFNVMLNEDKSLAGTIKAFLVELIRIDNQKKPIVYYEQLPINDTMLLCECINIIITKIEDLKSNF